MPEQGKEREQCRRTIRLRTGALRTRVHGTYLHADDDGWSVSLRRCRASLSAAWGVHIHHGDVPYLFLYSAAYGRYLSATTTPAPLPLGHRGFRVVQGYYDQPHVEWIMWQVVESGSGNDVLLRNVSGRYLRANGRYISCNNNGVTVDDFENVSTMRHWIVEPIPARSDQAADQLGHPNVDAE